MSFKKIDPVQNKDINHGGCLNCGGTHANAPMDMLVAAGFGMAMVTKDKEVIYSEDSNSDDWPELRRFEDMAKESPDCDWRVVLELPLRSAEYQRQGDEHWVLIKSGMGFA